MASESDSYPDFHSAETGEPFQVCISCGLPLRDDQERPYLVAKSYHRGECIFEYAICEDCRSNMAQEFSVESREALAGFFRERIRVEERSALLAHGNDPGPWLETCAACQTPRNQMESYSIGGLLLDGQMVFDPYPLCLCGKCEEEIQERLSKQTRGMWDDFMNTHFDGPPANAEDTPVTGRPVLI